MATDPSRLLELIAGGGPNPYANMRAGNLQAQAQQQDIATSQQAQQIAQFKLGLAQREQQQEQTYQEGVARYIANPTPQGLMALSAQFPDKAEALKKGWDVKDDAQKTADLTFFGSLHSALQNKKPDLAVAQLTRRRDAEAAAGHDVAELNQMIDGVKAGDKDAVNTVKGFALAQLGAADPKRFADNYGAVSKGSEGFTLAAGSRRYDADGKIIAEAPLAPEYRSVSPGETLVEVGGGGQGSSGAAAGTRGDVSRLINSNAGGGYVPDSVQTLGQFVTYGKSLNARGAKSSSAGTYQINGTTMAEFAPKVLGKDWKSAPFTAGTQERVGEAIFQWAKGQRDPAAALRGRWVSLTPNEAARLVQGDWSQARGLIAQKESGGSVPQGGGGARVVAQGAEKPGYQMLSPQETASVGLDPNVRYQRSPDGQITALGGQKPTQNLKALPIGVGKAIIENRGTLRQLDVALKELGAYPSAIGPTTGMLGDQVTNWRDPKGVAARAAIGKIGGQIIHDVSGAAVTLSEEPRFRPYVPLITDPPAVARQKLQQLRNLTQGVLGDYYDQYSEEQGYRPFASAARAAKPAPKQAAPSGFKILRVRPK